MVFRKILDYDMKNDLPIYFKNNNISFQSVKDIVEFNKEDSLNRAPYGQGIFKSIISDLLNLMKYPQSKPESKPRERNILIQQLKNINWMLLFL